METATYNSTGKVTYFKNMYGDENFYEYDYRDQLIYHKIVDSSGNTRESWCDYDQYGHLSHIKGYDGIEFWYFYDERGNIIHIECSDGNTETFCYDELGRIIYYKDRLNISHWYVYDEHGNSKCITSEDFFKSSDNA